MQLQSPSERWRDSFLAALTEFQAEGRYAEWNAATVGDFPALVARLRRSDMPHPRAPQSGLPQTVLWLIGDDTFLGRVTIRHRLDEWGLTHLGRIGYDIRPSTRGRGLGHAALRLALEFARDSAGLDRVLLICNPANHASERVIRAAGGVFAGQFEFDDWPRPLRHFWVELS